MDDRGTVLLICEKYFLRFYAPLAARLARGGFQPLWIAVNGSDRWDYEWIDPSAAIDRLAEIPDLSWSEDLDERCRFERLVFEQPDVFRRNYAYTMDVVRTSDRARRLAQAWYHATLALVSRFTPRAVLIWNGRYLPYSAVSAACEAAGQLLLTSEIGWVPGTIFLDRGGLSSDTKDLLGRTLESTSEAETRRADAFLDDYKTSKATMVAQPLMSAAEVRHRLLGAEGQFLLLYGCQVDWDTNVVIGARRFRSNEAAVSFLIECMSGITGARLVIKTHPLDSERREDALREILGNRGTVVSDIHPHVLIEAADCVSVRNSTLGFEALCYAKPLLLLEQAKYKHPELTLEARNVAEGAANLLSIQNHACRVPDPVVLRQFILHVIDRYLVPVPYRYFFEPDKLNILSHFHSNRSHQDLEAVLGQTAPLGEVKVNQEVLGVIERLKVHRPQGRAGLWRNVRKVISRLF
jgi:hypothetical protein